MGRRGIGIGKGDSAGGRWEEEEEEDEAGEMGG